MKKSAIDDASQGVEFHPQSLKLFIKKDEKESFLKLSLPLIITFWFPFMISFSTFRPNQGNVGVLHKNITNISSYPYIEDQGLNRTDKVLLEFNISRVYNDSITEEHDLEETEDNALQQTSPGEELFWKVLGYSTSVCERPIQDIYLQHKQKEVQTGRTHVAYLDLDEVRSITTQDIGLTGAPSGLVNITHRLEPDGTKYNYAAASKGAKVVAHDKEAKGASNILGEDHDMYLRNPCSVPDKFVVIELAEETLVDAITLANFEHHSSNFKQFELSGSLVFPTETWYELGTFVAENVKHRQYFKLPEPKWARYITLRLITHYGSEFYCTLSIFEAYGVDAIEKMLEDLIQSNQTALAERNEFEKGIEGDDDDDDDGLKKPLMVMKVPESVSKGNGRVHGDVVLKILMQKVRLVEESLVVLENSVKGLNKVQKEVVPQLDGKIGKCYEVMEQTRWKIEGFWQWKETMEKEFAELEPWKASVSFHLESVVKENNMLRQDIEKIANDEERLDKSEHALLCASLSVTIVVSFKILGDIFSKSTLKSKPKSKSKSDLALDLSRKKLRTSKRGWKPLVFTSIFVGAVTLTFC